MSVFALNDISFSYSQGNTVLENISLEIPKGVFLAMVGPNGAGKSTLLKLCVGLLKPDSGTVKILGVPIENFSDRHKLAYIAQQGICNRSFPVTVEEVVAMGRVAKLGIGRKPSKEDRAMIEEALCTVGMQQFSKRMIGELSGGQQQRVAIAKALVSNPEVVLMDEAMSGVDAKSRDNIYALLKSINETCKTSIILVSHDVDRVSQFAGQILSINGGISYYGSSAGFNNCCEVRRNSWADKVNWGKLSNA
ncbi:metal ABC transporter ATP-binding protein [Dendrosporobacter sp. 1207_IL3150]|uniref:metal ABC transporter ATP-binding protein n=1 Tax=Dendrosporobacter sp. 1207_IL3150 TaxID=3084054 RepID=UPI002FD956BF